jgi:hypothetical protein
MVKPENLLTAKQV